MSKLWKNIKCLLGKHGQPYIWITACPEFPGILPAFDGKFYCEHCGRRIKGKP